MHKLDEIDCGILNLLQINCRTSLTDISKQVNLSIDAVKNRIKKMLENNVFHPKIQIRPRKIGFNIIVEVKVKLRFITESKVYKFLSYLIEHPYVSEIFAVSGNWDYSLVIIARDAFHLGEITSEIRIKFGEMIRSWTESLTTNSYKFEYYDMLKLMNFGNPKKEFDFLKLNYEKETEQD